MEAGFFDFWHLASGLESMLDQVTNTKKSTGDTEQDDARSVKTDLR